jgi:hypothetical protein
MDSQDKVLIGTAEANVAMANNRQLRKEFSIYTPLQRETQQLAGMVLLAGEAQRIWDGRVD